MEIPKSQEKLYIRKLPNMGKKPNAYEVRRHDGRYLGDIRWSEGNNQWCLSGLGGFYLSANVIEEINEFIKKLPKNKSR